MLISESVVESSPRGPRVLRPLTLIFLVGRVEVVTCSALPTRAKRGGCVQDDVYARCAHIAFPTTHKFDSEFFAVRSL